MNRIIRLKCFSCCPDWHIASEMHLLTTSFFVDDHRLSMEFSTGRVAVCEHYVMVTSAELSGHC